MRTKGKKVKVDFYMDPDEFHEMEAIRGLIPRSSFIASTLRKAYNLGDADGEA